MQREACEECKGTGLIKVASGEWSRPYYSKEHNAIMRNFHCDGKWQEAPCPCLAENDND